MTALVSVVMAVYNGQCFLGAQVRSVLMQLEPGDELIVVDDASTDGSLALLQAMSEPSMRIVSNVRNLGLRATFERGLAMASHDILFLCDQDDVWLPGKRTAMASALAADPHCVLVVSDAQLIDGAGHVTSESFMRQRGGFRAGFLATLIKNRYLGCAMAFRRSLLGKVLPFPRDIPMHDMWIGSIAALSGGVRYLPMPLLQYRRHGTNASPSRRQGLRQMLFWRLSLLRAVVARLFC